MRLLCRLRHVVFRRSTAGCGVICPTGKSVIWLSSPSAKNIPLLRRPKSTLELPPSRPTQRGVSRSSRTLERDAVDAAASGAYRQLQGGSNGARERSSGTQTNGAVFAFTKALADWSVEAFGADGSRTAKPCGPGTRCWCQVGGGKSARPGLTKPKIRQRR
jgi:hypothetical protein